MNFVVLSSLTPGTGNLTSAQRLADFLSDTGGTVVLKV